MLSFSFWSFHAWNTLFLEAFESFDYLVFIGMLGVGHHDESTVDHRGHRYSQDVYRSIFLYFIKLLLLFLVCLIVCVYFDLDAVYDGDDSIGCENRPIFNGE